MSTCRLYVCLSACLSIFGLRILLSICMSAMYVYLSVYRSTGSVCLSLDYFQSIINQSFYCDHNQGIIDTVYRNQTGKYRRSKWYKIVLTGTTIYRTHFLPEYLTILDVGVCMSVCPSECLSVFLSIV